MSTILKYRGFEIICKVGSVLKYRDNNLSLKDALVSECIYKNATKGDKAKKDDVEKTFGNIGNTEILAQILTRADYSPNTQERKEMTATKRKEIIQYISSNYTDPKNKTVIPITRIESAIDQIKPRLDIYERTEKQAIPIIKKMQLLIPMAKIEGMKGTICVPHMYVKETKAILKKWAKVESEMYGTDAKFLVSFSTGNYDCLMSELKNKTRETYSFNL